MGKVMKRAGRRVGAATLLAVAAILCGLTGCQQTMAPPSGAAPQPVSVAVQDVGLAICPNEHLVKTELVESTAGGTTARLVCRDNVKTNLGILQTAMSALRQMHQSGIAADDLAYVSVAPIGEKQGVEQWTPALEVHLTRENAKKIQSWDLDVVNPLWKVISADPDLFDVGPDGSLQLHFER